MTRSLTRLQTCTTALLLATGTILSTGCVSQRSHDDLLSINRQLEERRVDLEQQVAALMQSLAEKDAAIRAMQDQSGANAALRQRLEEEQRNASDLRAEIKALQDEIAKLGEGGGDIIVVEGALPPEVSDALRDLAAANADLMEYDEARGMIRLRSDLTFALGSADVNANAQTALARLAGVLNDGAARGFDVQVIGHTDAVPVRSALGKQLHIDNRGLSSNRGDAVARVIIAKGIAAQRVVSGGRGATQPITPNDAKGQSKANRRVEIFLVKGTSGAGNGGASAPAPDRAPIIRTGGGNPQPGVEEASPRPQDDSIFK